MSSGTEPLPSPSWPFLSPDPLEKRLPLASKSLLLPTSSEALLPNTQEAELPSEFEITTSKPSKDSDVMRKAWRLLTLRQSRLRFVRVLVEVAAPPEHLSDQAGSGGSGNSPSIEQEKEPSHAAPSQITNSSSLTLY